VNVHLIVASRANAVTRALTPANAKRWALPAMAVAAAALAAWLSGRLPTFVDETVMLETGWLMAEGSILYRDLFSHHFPLPYLWTAAVIDLVGPSRGLVRLSIWLLLPMTALALTRTTRFRASLWVFVLCWTIIRVMVHGHMAMYVAWSTTACWALFVLGVSMLDDGIRSRAGAALMVGVLSAVALLTDPLSVYVVAATGIVLLRSGMRTTLIALAAACGTSAVVLGALAADGAVVAFFDQAIAFNRVYSAKYVGMDGLRLDRLAQVALALLGLGDPIWRNANPLRAATLGYGEFDVWLLAGVAYRVALLGASLRWLVARRPLDAAWLYGIAVAAQANDTIGFRAGSLASMGVFVLVALVCREWPAGRRDGRAGLGWRLPSAWSAERTTQARRILSLGASTLAGLTLAWLVARSSGYAFSPHRVAELGGQWAFDGYEAARLEALACQADAVQLGYWPAGSAAYHRTGFRPVAGYVALWPWIAEHGLPRVLDALARDDARAIVVIQDTKVWDRWDTREYLAPLRAMLDATYVHVGDATWVSPVLSERCAP